MNLRKLIDKLKLKAEKQEDLRFKKSEIELANEANQIAQDANKIAREANTKADISNTIAKSSRIQSWMAIGLTVLFSCGNLWLSWQANNTSNKAFNLADKYNLLENRPYLNLEVVKHDNTNFYLKIERLDSNKLRLTAIYRLFNAGKIPAKNIKFEPSLSISDTKIEINSEVPIIDIGPNQESHAELSFELSAQDSKAKDVLEQIEQGEFAIQTQIIVYYSSSLDKNARYQTKINYDMKKTTAYRSGIAEML